MSMLVVENLKKQFGSKQAVNGVNLELQAGEFYALLGPNGAGKTTTMRMIVGLLEPDTGKISIMGHNMLTQAESAKQELAFLPDDPLLYGKLRPLEYLEFIAGLWQVDAEQAAKQAKELLILLDLWNARHDYSENFSRGMMQKLALAGAMIHKPKLIIMDEPLTGLDAASARLVKEVLQHYVKQGNTVVFSTHIMDMAERLAERIGIIHQGRMVAEGRLDELRNQAGGEQDNSLEQVFLELTETQEMSEDVSKLLEGWQA